MKKSILAAILVVVFVGATLVTFSLLTAKPSPSGALINNENLNTLVLNNTGIVGQEIVLNKEAVVQSGDNGGANKTLDNHLPKENANPSIVQQTIANSKRTYVKNEVITAIGRQSEVRLIVKMKDKSKSDAIKNRLKAKGNIKDYVFATVNEQELADAIQEFSDGDIESIQVDHAVTFFLDDVVKITNAATTWDLGATGKGQTVCVLDSGIDYNHPALADNYIGGYDFVNNDNDPMDDNGHGTYVTGAVVGVAPDVKILSVKVLANDSIGYESDIIKGINYCIDNKEAYNVSVILMAFGAGEYNTSCYCDSNLIVQEATRGIEEGIFPVAAAGNSAKPFLMAPACGSQITSVGATYKNDTVTRFSNIEPLLDLLAPGYGINSTKLGGEFAGISGTSLSAAIVAGVAALVLENQSLSPAELNYRFRSTGVLVEYNNVIYPRVDAYAALTNKITVTPIEQQGVQCEGTWDEYRPLATTCLGSTCFSCAGNIYIQTCEGCPGVTACLDCCDYGTCICSTSFCSAECNVSSNCGSGGGGTCDTSFSSTGCQCTSVTTCSGSYKCFTIKDSSALPSAIFDSGGNLDLKGTLAQAQTKPCSPPAGSFIIKNSTGACVAYINSTGSIWLGGTARQNQAGPCSAPTNSLIFKNASGACVAYINSTGGMWLDGSYNTLASI